MKIDKLKNGVGGAMGKLNGMFSSGKTDIEKLVEYGTEDELRRFTKRYGKAATAEFLYRNIVKENEDD